ncbi:MAG TPA: ice-binding family protein [Vicinamibacterales bacterium]|nr:ice-binding family protein [Vicinamibacterales bacterium]
MWRRCVRPVASVGLAVLVSLAFPSRALAQGYLGGNLRPFAVLAGTPNVTCTGASTITGDVGVSPAAAIVGFPVPCTNVGTLHAADATAAAAQLDLTTAYTTLAGLPCAASVGPNLAGLTLTQGVYCVGAAASNLTGTLTLDAQGNPNAVFVFQMSSSLITSSGSTVSVINGGNACGVQWQVGSSATIGTGTAFVGNILALTSIAINTGANLTGRALARNGAVTLDVNNISSVLCGAGGGAGGAPPPFPPLAVPTLPEMGAWALLVLLLGGGVYLLSRRTRATSGH